MPARIFISHSVKGDTESGRVLDAIEAKLKKLKDRYSVLLDHSTLKPGEDWRPAINVWCGSCDAAILLITPDSMKSDYCVYEWSILGYRRRGSKNFKILPIYHKATVEELRGKPQQIDEIAGSFVYSDDAQTLFKLEEWLADIVEAEDRPTDQSTAIVASIFRMSLTGLDESVIKRALADANLTFGTWEPLKDQWQQLSTLLYARGLFEAEPALNHFVDWFREDKDLSDIVDMIASSWVDDWSAATLKDLCLGPCTERGVALNASDIRSIDPYLNKASGLRPSGTKRVWQRVEVNDSAANLEDLKFMIAEELINKLSPGRTLDAKELAEKLESQSQSKRPVIVSIHPGTWLTEEWYQEIRRAFPCVTFFLLFGQERRELQGVTWLKPDLPQDFEGTFWSRYGKILENLERN